MTSCNLPARFSGKVHELYFFALQSDISIVRHERIDQAEPRLEQRERYRLVAALAAPSEQPPLKIEEDRRAIERMLGKVTTIGMVDPVWVEGATRQSLREALRQSVDIFHFSGHGYFDGKIGQIILDKGMAKEVTSITRHPWLVCCVKRESSWRYLGKSTQRSAKCVVRWVI